MLSPGFKDNPLYIALWRHSDKTSAVINNHYLDLLVNDNHVDNNLKEKLVYVYFGSIVNNQARKYISTRAGVCKTLCPQLPDSITLFDSNTA